MKKITDVIEEIKQLKSKEEVMEYCANLEGYSRGHYNYTSYEDSTTTVGYLTNDQEKYEYETDIPNFCLIIEKEIGEEPDEDYIPDLFYIGINFESKKIAKYRYSQWDDGDCSEIVESHVSELNF